MIKRLIINIGVLATSIGFTCFLIVRIVNPIVRDTNEYVAASIDKENRLKAISEPKIILIAGSNIAFGLNCKTLQKSIGHPVVNMGLHAGLGLRFMLNEVKTSMKARDIVLLSPEYNLSVSPDLKLLAQLVDVNPNANRFINLTLNESLIFYVYDIQRFLTSGLNRIGSKFSTHIYLRNGFSPEGDLTTYLTTRNQPFLPESIDTTSLAADIKDLNEFIKAANQKHVVVKFLYPTLCKSAYDLNHDVIEYTAGRLNKSLECDILNKPKTFVYSDNLYFNSSYHLNYQGRTVRTKDLLQCLLGNRLSL